MAGQPICGTGLTFTKNNCRIVTKIEGLVTKLLKHLKLNKQKKILGALIIVRRFYRRVKQTPSKDR
jgi:hypothetical protein